MNKNNEKNLIVITGCDTGIGKSLCRVFLDEGYTVLASYLVNPPFPAKNNLITQKMDLRKEKEIGAFAASVKNLSKKGFIISALIHNSGMVLAAPVENMPLSGVREVFEVNYFGLYSLTQKLIPLLIKDKGKIIINGSFAGRIGLPYFSPYVSSKFALEGFTESLRREMRPFGVKTVILEPGAVATPIWNNSWKRIKKELLPKVNERYKKGYQSGAGKFIAGGNQGLPSDEAAGIIYKIFLKKNPKARYIISKSILIDNLTTMIPSPILDRLIGLMFK